MGTHVKIKTAPGFQEVENIKKMRIDCNLPYDYNAGWIILKTPEEKAQHVKDITELRPLLNAINTIRKVEGKRKITKVTKTHLAEYCRYQIVFDELVKLGRVTERTLPLPSIHR